MLLYKVVILSYSLTLLELSNNKRLQSLPEGLHKLPHLTAVHVLDCHPNLLKSREIRYLHGLVKKKASNLAYIQCTQRMPIQHNFDLLIDRPVEVVNHDIRVG